MDVPRWPTAANSSHLTCIIGIRTIAGGGAALPALLSLDHAAKGVFVILAKIKLCIYSTLHQLLSECESAWIVDNCQRLQSEFDTFLRRQQLDGSFDLLLYAKFCLMNMVHLDLSRLFNLLLRVKDGVAPLVAVFEQFIIQSGKERLHTVSASKV